MCPGMSGRSWVACWRWSCSGTHWILASGPCSSRIQNTATGRTSIWQPWERRLVEEHQRVQRVAVLGQGVRQEAVVRGVGCRGEQHPVEPGAPLGVVHLVLVPRPLRDLHADAEVHAVPTHHAHPSFTLLSPDPHGCVWTSSARTVRPIWRSIRLGPVGEAEVPAVEFAPARRISTVCGSATTMWATQPKSLMPAMRTMAPTRRGSATAASCLDTAQAQPGMLVLPAPAGRAASGR